MERKLNAELWDKMHYLFRDYNDRMVHVRLDYDFVIDAEKLKTVLICFFEKSPVLHARTTRWLPTGRSSRIGSTMF